MDSLCQPVFWRFGVGVGVGVSGGDGNFYDFGALA